MSAATDAILDRIIPIAPPENLRLLVGMLEDRIGGDAGLDKLEDAVAFAQANWTPLFRKAPVAPATTSTAPTSIRPETDRVAREARERQVRQIPSMTANPWAKGTVNVTQQVMIAARDPARAAKLKAAAGV